MINVKPVNENTARDEIKNKYQQINSALGTNTVPLFFQYIAAFPEYFEYIATQLITNLNDQKFIHLVHETKNTLLPLIRTGLPKSKDICLLLDNYRHSPAFYNFQADTQKIFITNMKLAFVFVALREAVKGWAIAAKKLPSNHSDHPNSTIKEDKSLDEKQFVSDEAYSDSLTKAPSGSIEPAYLPKYMTLCRNEFWQSMKTEQFLMIRLGVEKVILHSLPLFPNLIFSPVNVVIRLSQKYPDFSDLLYLLSEHFPTFAVQRLMFSGFMLE